MAEETAYFFYILSKCDSAKVKGALPQGFKSIEELVSSYKNNGYFSNYQLVEALNEEIMNQQFPEEHLLDPDARVVLDRCKNGIYNLRHENVNDFDVMFGIITDFLWINASIRCNHTDREGKCLHLIEWPNKEISEIKKYLEDMQNIIVLAKQDLNAMQEAQKLPFLKQIFIGTIKDEAVQYYVNLKSNSEFILKDQITKCQKCIRKKEILYYTFVASYILRVSLE